MRLNTVCLIDDHRLRLGSTKRCCWRSVATATNINSTHTIKNHLWIVLYCAISANHIAPTISPILVTVSCTPVISALCFTSTSCEINHKIMGRRRANPAAIINDSINIPPKLSVIDSHHNIIPIPI